MATTSSTFSTKMCRKCQGKCPPCRPWRCKFSKGRSLEECGKSICMDIVNTREKVRRTSSEQILNPSEEETIKHIRIVLSSLNPHNIFSAPNGTACSDKSNEILPTEGASSLSISNRRFSSIRMSTTNISSRLGSPATSQHRRQISCPRQMIQNETSHIFLAIAIDPFLVEYSKTVLNHVIAMPEIPEINSLDDSRCIWPYSIHFTIHSFGKVLNAAIPSIADYSKKNIAVTEPFSLNITGMLHHQKLHTIGYAVEKQTVEPLLPIKMNMSKWFKKGINWDGYNPIFSLVRTKCGRGAKNCAPLSEKSIKIILQKFGRVRYTQEVIPARDIQLCLARSSTKTSFYKNLLVRTYSQGDKDFLS